MTTKKREACPNCGCDLYAVTGLCNDRDGIRSDRWCEECKIMFKSTAACLVPRLILQDHYRGRAKQRLQALAEQILEELK